MTTEKPQWYDRLHELDSCLRDAKLKYSPDRWLNVHDLFITLHQQGRLPSKQQNVVAYLSPLFCSNPQEQAEFQEIFANWWQSVDAAEPQSSQLSQAAPTAKATTIKKLSIIPLWPFLAVTLLLTFGLSYFVFNKTSVESPLIVESPPVVEQIPSPESQTEIRDNLLPLMPLSARTPAEPLMLTDENQARQALLQQWIFWLISSSIFIAWLVWRIWRRQVALNRRRDELRDPLTELHLHGSQDDLFDGPEVRQVLRRLHQPDYFQSRRVHEQRTVDFSVRHAGLYSPVYQELAYVPEILVWVDVQHTADPVIGLAATLAKRLRQNGLLVHVFTSYGSTERLYDESRQRWLSLTELVTRHARARLVIVGESRLLIDDWTGQLYPWVVVLQHWRHRLLLLPVPEAHRLLAPLQESGLLLASLTSQGLLKIGENLAYLSATRDSSLQSSQRLLPSLLQSPERWRTPLKPPEAQLQQLIGVLSRYLGQEGKHLLAAMAFYPQVHWGLMRAMDMSLWPEHGSAKREARLLRLISLPWVRSGWLPDWLRRCLVEDLTAKQTLAISDIYLQLFSALEQQGKGGIVLPMRLTNISRVLWQWMQDLIHGSPKQSVLRDQIFASLSIMGRTRRTLAFLLPQAAAKYLLHRGLRGGWLDASIALCLAALLGWAGQCLWQGQGGKQLLRQQQSEFATYHINIENSAESTALAAELITQLRLQGFEQFSPENFSIQPIPPAEKPVIPETLFPRLKVSAVQADVEAARFIQQRLRYLAYHLPVTLNVNDTNTTQGTINLVLDTQNSPFPSQPVQGFRDHFIQPFDKSQWLQSLPQQVTEAKSQTAQSAKTITAIEPVMVELKGGVFDMGCVSDIGCSQDEKPVHPVTISAFAIGKYEVTFEEYDRFVEATGREKPDDRSWGRGRRPVMNVNWQDANDYAKWLSQQTGKNYRLPSEAEWEYAARAGTTTPFSTGDCIHTDLANYNGNYDFNNCGAKTSVYREKTVPVDQLAPNPWGLYHMHGNVWEWVQDCWHGNYQGAPNDGSAWLGETKQGDCTRRVVRGGGWFSFPVFLRSAFRFWFNPLGATLMMLCSLCFFPLDFFVSQHVDWGEE